MNYNQITELYYTKWLGINKILSAVKGIEFIYSAERNASQYGYSTPFDIYCLYQTDRIIVSYGGKAKDKIVSLKDKTYFPVSVDEFKATLKDVYGVVPYHNIKFIFNNLPPESKIARTLITDDYIAYLDFFRKTNPGCINTDWVRVYFDEMVANRLCAGVFAEDMLVSCTDMPGMPYIQNEVQEIGINTLYDYRGKGYASAACILCAKHIIENGKCPQWSTGMNNIASEKLAYKVGFTRYADVLTVTL